MSEILNEIPVEETTSAEELIPQRVNPFCVISNGTYNITDINGNEHKFHLIETNSSWGENPYSEDYAVVPDNMVLAILETHGFCDIVLNEDGTEVVSFTALEIPKIPIPKTEPSANELIAELTVKYYELEQTSIEQDLAILELYESLHKEV